MVSTICAGCMFLASMFSLTGAVWQHVAAASAASVAKFAIEEGLHTKVGPAAAGLAWTTFMLAGMVFIGLVVMMLSISLLDRLTDD